MIPGLYKIFDHWHAEGTVYIYSDPHFYDEEIVAGMPERPSAEEQVKLINSKVGMKDTLIILGDCGDPAMCAKLRGYEVLIMETMTPAAVTMSAKRFLVSFPKKSFRNLRLLMK